MIRQEQTICGKHRPKLVSRENLLIIKITTRVLTPPLFEVRHL